MTEQAWLLSIERNFGGDTAIYELRGSNRKEARVTVSWALLRPYMTDIFIDGKKIREFSDKRYIQPHVALAMVGIEVHGLVDFAGVQEPIESDDYLRNDNPKGEEAMNHITWRGILNLLAILAITLAVIISMLRY